MAGHDYETFIHLFIRLLNLIILIIYDYHGDGITFLLKLRKQKLKM